MINNIEIEVPIFNDEYAVMVIICNRDMAKEKLRKWHTTFEDSDLENRRGVMIGELNPNTNPTIWVGLPIDDNHFYGTLAHETIHAIDHIFDIMGENSAREIFAHCVGAVVGKVEKYLKTMQAIKDE